MSGLYFGVVTLVWCVALPWVVWLSWRSQKHRDALPARFWLRNNPPFSRTQGIWFHACSMGEVRSLAPFIQALSSSPVQISVITQTGFAQARQFEGCEVRYLPFEPWLWGWVKPQRTLVVLEAELWPLLFICAKKRGAKTIVLNARISDRSWPSYRRFAFFYRWLFGAVDVVFAQSQLDQERLQLLGAKDVRVGGNIKTLQRYPITHAYTKRAQGRVIVLASTHAQEEALILSQILPLREDQLIIVPRHPERFDAVDTLLEAYAHKEQRSYARLSHAPILEADVVLCDQMGELINLYAIADVVILGGSFVEGVGGHNPLEPAFFGVKLISGPFIFNQHVLYAQVEHILTCKLEDLREAFERIDTHAPASMVHQGDIAPLLKEIDGKSL